MLFEVDPLNLHYMTDRQLRSFFYPHYPNSHFTVIKVLRSVLQKKCSVWNKIRVSK